MLYVNFQMGNLNFSKQTTPGIGDHDVHEWTAILPEKEG